MWQTKYIPWFSSWTTLSSVFVIEEFLSALLYNVSSGHWGLNRIWSMMTWCLDFDWDITTPWIFWAIPAYIWWALLFLGLLSCCMTQFWLSFRCWTDGFTVMYSGGHDRLNRRLCAMLCLVFTTCSCALESNISTLISSVQRTLLQRSCGMFILNVANLNCAVLCREKSRPPGNVSKQANPFLIAVSWSFKFNILTEVCRVWGVAAVSLNIAWTDLGLYLLGRPLPGRLWLCVNIHLKASHWQFDKTSAFTEVLTPADDQLSVFDQHHLAAIYPLKSYESSKVILSFSTCLHRVTWKLSFSRL